MVNADNNQISVVRQCELLNISRSGLYYQPKGESALNLALMAEIDRVFLEYPFFGFRKMRDYLNNTLGYSVGKKRVRRLMNLMGLVPIYQTPRTTIPDPDHQKFPYLLRGITIDHCNQVWSSDITYIPIKNGFLYLVAVMDWHSRKVLSWRLSNSMDTDFCVAAVEEALARYGKPDIFNTDQGSQFTSAAFTSLLQRNGIKVSMDGRGRCLDNVFVERLWRSLKYEDVYLNNYESGKEAHQGIARWLKFYNEKRPHNSLGGVTPDKYYAEKMEEAA